MTDEEVERLDCGLYRLHWATGGSSLASVGMLYDDTRWFAATNWTGVGPQSVASTDWRLVGSAEPLEPVGRKEYAETMAVFGDRVLDSDVASLAVRREREACAKEADTVMEDSAAAADGEERAALQTAAYIASNIRARGHE